MAILSVFYSIFDHSEAVKVKRKRGIRRTVTTVKVKVNGQMKDSQEKGEGRKIAMDPWTAMVKL